MAKNEPITMESLKTPLDSDAVIVITFRNQKVGGDVPDDVNFLLRQEETPWTVVKSYLDRQAKADVTIRSIPNPHGEKKATFYALFHDTVWIVTVTLSKRKSKASAAKHERGENPRVSHSLKARMNKVLGKR